MTSIVKHIFEQFMARKFAHVDTTESYYTEWRKRFQNGMEWQRSDYSNRAVLKAIAPSIYPEDKNKFFIRQ